MDGEACVLTKKQMEKCVSAQYGRWGVGMSTFGNTLSHLKLIYQCIFWGGFGMMSWIRTSKTI